MWPFNNIRIFKGPDKFRAYTRDYDRYEFAEYLCDSLICLEGRLRMLSVNYTTIFPERPKRLTPQYLNRVTSLIDEIHKDASALHECVMSYHRPETTESTK